MSARPWTWFDHGSGVTAEDAAVTVRKRRLDPKLPSCEEMHRQIVKACKRLGYRVHSAPRFTGGDPGYPSLTIAGHGRLFIILPRGPITDVNPEHEAWIHELDRAGVDVRIVWPSSLLDFIRELATDTKRAR